VLSSARSPWTSVSASQLYLVVSVGRESLMAGLIAVMLQFCYNQILTLLVGYVCAYIQERWPEGLINCIVQLPSYVTWASE